MGPRCPPHHQQLDEGNKEREEKKGRKIRGRATQRRVRMRMERTGRRQGVRRERREGEEREKRRQVIRQGVQKGRKSSIDKY